MKILHVNASDSVGGAAIAAMRHCRAMRATGIDAKLLCVVPQTDEPFVYGIDSMTTLTEFMQKVYGKLNHLKTKRFTPYATWSVADWGFDISKHPLVKQADEIWLHWINGGMLSVKSIEKILKLGKPVTWYLHDMWPLTGGCHYSLGCKGFEKECVACPLLYDRSGSTNPTDISNDLMRKKLARWVGYPHLRIIAPSRWLTDLVHKSALFGGKNLTATLPNPLDTDLFAPLPKAEARNRLNLPADRPLILFGAHNVNDPYKGMHYLIEALPLLKDSGAEFIVFGHSSQDLSADSLPVKIHSIGSVSSAEKLRQIYSAADLFVTPSLADNYPNVLVEAMACGTPCVGFNIGGIPEIIHDGISGLIAPDITSEALAQTITRALPQADTLGQNARAQILQTNSFPAYARHLGQLPQTQS